MPRIAENRAPAEPVSADQKERYQRILRAAARLGTQHGHERMQMTDVAKEAGVAIATLYRYFPSKNDLFLGLLRSQVNTLVPVTVDAGALPSQAVAETLLIASRRLLERPLLATAMLQANNAAQLKIGPEGSDVTNSFHVVLFRALGITDATAQDERMVRLVEQAWYGVLISVLNSVITAEESEDDIRLTCELLLGPTYDRSRGDAENQE
ncbi:TetR family transcriptional regulator [Nocardioides daejeonensis]|uniref:TetR family transcriptional regulator n=1 Tax=Nocardioides daejeonensis TaxID=1046556 RepID=UPI000D74DB51|nr:TetR family transcriptional regulator [Nocardioides daejeonensis]